LLLLLSPAKTMNFTDKIPMVGNNSEPVFLKQAIFLNKILLQMDSSNLKNALQLSDKQLLPVIDSIKMFCSDNIKRQAIYAYRGAVYKAIDSLSLNGNQIKFAQNHIRILSGLYGILKPLDLIQQYRLDMKSKIKIPNTTNLYQYWKNIISDYILKDNPYKTLVNLSSREFSKMVDFTIQKVRIIDISFSEINNNILTSPPMYSKIARGKMTGFIIRNFLTVPEEIKKYNLDGYSFNNYLSSDNSYIFTREHH